MLEQRPRSIDRFIPATRHLRLALSVCLSFASMNCKGESEPTVGDEGLSRLLLEVSYEPNAEPFTGATARGGNTWDLFGDNMRALFEGTGVTVEAPSELSGMQPMEAMEGDEYTTERILELDARYRITASSPETKVIHALWLDGYFSDGEPQSGIIGVSLGDTGVIAIFKPVVQNLGLTAVGKTFGEQTTLIHEVGHALGLVDNGLTMQTPHKDEEHGAHCVDDSCVMYWANEGPSDLVDFVSRYIASGQTLLFDTDCLSDVQNAFAAAP